MIGLWESIAVIILGSALVLLSGVLISKIIEWVYGSYLERKGKLDCLEETNAIEVKSWDRKEVTSCKLLAR